MTPEQRKELKPCPFCGGPVTLERAIRIGEMGARDWWGIKCRNTMNLGGTCAIEQIPSGSPEAAIERWNRRAQVEALTVPQWISVEDRLPEPGVLVMVWQSRQEWNYPDDLLISFDCIDSDDDDAATWRGHNNWYEEYCVIGKPEGSTGPLQDAPYTHWKPMDAAPTIPAMPGTKEGM